MIEAAGDAVAAVQLADADHLQPVVGLEDDLGHAGIVRHAVDFDVLQARARAAVVWSSCSR